MNRRALLKTLGLGGLGTLLLGAESMTTPTPHGFPDWGRQLAASDISLLNVNNVAIPGSRVDGPIFVGNMPYMYVHALCANQAEIVLDWFSDAAGTVPLERDQLVTGIGGDVTQCVPVAGPYVRITTNVSVNPSLTTLRMYMTSTPFAHFATTGGLNTLISIDNALLGGGATVVLNATAARGGWITWRVTAFNAATFLARLYAVNFAGAATLIDSINIPGFAGGGMMLAPAMPLRLSITNGDAGAHTYFATVVHHPFYP